MSGPATADVDLVKVGEVSASRSVYSRINFFSVLLAILTVVFPFGLMRGELLVGTAADLPRILLPGLLLIVPVHEGIHWLAAVLVGVPARHCRFGIYWRRAMPYFRSMVPLPVGRYRLVLLAPGVGLFIVLMVPTLLTRNFAWAILAAMALVSGAGDYYWFWRIRRLPSHQWVWDKAGLIGLEVLERPA